MSETLEQYTQRMKDYRDEYQRGVTAERERHQEGRVIREPYNGYYTQGELKAMEAEAARVERERCVRIVENHVDNRVSYALHTDMVNAIAAAIREGK